MFNKTISGLLKIIHAYKTENKRLKALLKAYSIDFESYDDICDHEVFDEAEYYELLEHCLGSLEQVKSKGWSRTEPAPIF